MRRFFLWMSLALPVWGHDLYLLPGGFWVNRGGPVTVAFHNGDDFPVPDRPPKVENVLDAAWVGAGGRIAMKGLRVEEKILRAEVELAEAGSGYLVARTRPNLIELEPSKFASYLAHEGLTGVLVARATAGESSQVGRERYSKYVKSLVTVEAGSAFWKEKVGFPIEIIPERDPAALRPGGSLPVRVEYRGKAAADVQIEMAWMTPEGTIGRKVAGRTDAAGRIVVPIGAAGAWKLHTVFMERCAEPAVADWESYWASLTFGVKP